MLPNKICHWHFFSNQLNDKDTKQFTHETRHVYESRNLNMKSSTKQEDWQSWRALKYVHAKNRKAMSIRLKPNACQYVMCGV